MGVAKRPGLSLQMSPNWMLSRVGCEGLLENFCQNMAFWVGNAPNPLISEILAQVVNTILEAVCRNGTGGGHSNWAPHLRTIAEMKIQMPHFRGRFGITLNKGSAISAFYAATCALIV